METIRDFRSTLKAKSIAELKARVERSHIGKTRTGTRHVDAYVNHGRWVADCLCGSGVACAPDSPEAVCLECGTVHRVRFPKAKDIEDVTAVLVARPLAARNWRPDEQTRDDLAAENLARALPIEGRP